MPPLVRPGLYEGRNTRITFKIYLLAGLGIVFLLVWAAPARSAPPEISFVQLYSSNMLIIHFDTAANRTYYLQYTDKLGTNGGGGAWSNLYIVAKTVDPNHYAVPDWRTNKARFYRLMVTP